MGGLFGGEWMVRALWGVGSEEGGGLEWMESEGVV